MSQTPTEYDAAALPSAVTAYLDARDAKRHADASALFTPDAVVVDDGSTYQGTDAISSWIANTSTEFEYTVTRLGQAVEGSRAEVLVRLDGNFPGGTVMLWNRFDLADGAIRALSIEP